MSDMPNHPRLMKRGSVYYHRAAVPEDIRGTYTKREEIASLRTRDPREALKLVRIEAARIDALFETHRKEQERLNAPKLPSLSPEQIRVVAEAHYAVILEEDEQERLRGFSGDEEFDLFANDTEEVEKITRELYARGQVPGFVKLRYAEITQRLALPWTLEDNSESWPVISRAMVSASLKAIEGRKKRNVGQVVETPTLANPKQGAAMSRGTTITRLFESWKRDHLANGKSLKTAADFEQKVEALKTFLGHDDALRVTRKNIADFCQDLRHEKGLSARTVSDKYLATVRTIYKAAVSKVMLEIDPTANVRVRVPRADRGRSKGFTDEEAKAILSASLAGPETLGKRSELTKLAIKWTPWICAYTGARVTEITQLRQEDFAVEYGIPVIRITPDAGSVKTGQYRHCPIHPHLVELGLLDFVKARPAGPLFLQKTGRKGGGTYTKAENVSKALGKWVRDVAGIADSRVQPNHGWRHRFKTVARDVGIEQRYADAMQGHTDGSASAEYGENTMKALNREIQRLPRFEV
jgi:integrase